MKPMLAATAKLDKLNDKFWQSLKLEGVRLEVLAEDGILTRALKPFNNTIIYERFEQVERYCYDHNINLEGELYVHGWPFKRIDSAARGEGNIDARQLELHVFDIFIPDDADLTFESRYEAYCNHVAKIQQLGIDFIKPCHYYQFNSATDTMEAYNWAISNGYEGLAFKRSDLAYKQGRSTVNQGYFLRIKPEDPYDGICLGLLERQYNLCESETNELGHSFKRQNKEMKASAGMVQNAIVYTPAINKVHKVAMTRGLTDPDRALLWDNKDKYVGMPIQWVGIPIPGQEVPRSPRFDKWREDIQPTFLQHNESESLLVEWDQAAVTTYLQQGCDIISLGRFLLLYNEANGYTLGY